MLIKNLTKNGPVGVLKRCCTMAAVRIRALTTEPRIKPTSIFPRSAWRPNPGRRSTYRRGDFLFKQPGPTLWECPCDPTQSAQLRGPTMEYLEKVRSQLLSLRQFT